MGMKELVIWHEMDGVGDKSRMHIEQICEEITAKYGIPFHFEVMNIAPYIDRLKHLEAEEVKPDIIFIPQDLVNLKEAKLSSVPDSYQSFMEKPIWDSMKYEGVQRGVPYVQGNHAVIYYNKRYLGRAPRNMKELLSIRQPDIHAFAMDLNVAYWVVPFLYTMNGNPFKDKEFRLQNDVAGSVMRRLQQMYDAGLLYDSEAIGTMLEEFVAGHIATMINGEWLYEYLLEEMGEDLGVCELPELEGRPMTGVSTSVGVAFPWNALEGEKKDELDVFIRYMLSEEVQRRWLTNHHRFPVNRRVLEQMEDMDLDENMRNSYRQMHRNVFLKNETCMKYLWTTCDDILDAVKQA